MSPVITNEYGSFIISLTVYKGRSYKIDLEISKSLYKTLSYQGKLTLSYANDYQFAFSPGVLIMEYIAQEVDG